jgi:lipopolysaccharide/colanic/teichoic acid biosynthesis glycosyltransferase
MLSLAAQIRVGKGGEPFKIYKFRTMVVDAEARPAEIRQERVRRRTLQGPEEAAKYAAHVVGDSS